MISPLSYVLFFTFRPYTMQKGFKVQCIFLMETTMQLPSLSNRLPKPNSYLYCTIKGPY